MIVWEKVWKSRLCGWIVKVCGYDGGNGKVKKFWYLVHKDNCGIIHGFGNAKDAKVWAKDHRI